MRLLSFCARVKHDCCAYYNFRGCEKGLLHSSLMQQLLIGGAPLEEMSFEIVLQHALIGEDAGAEPQHEGVRQRCGADGDGIGGEIP